MRLDVDRKRGSLAPNPHAALPALTNYAIPPDNPYVGAASFNYAAINSPPRRVPRHATEDRLRSFQ